MRVKSKLRPFACSILGGIFSIIFLSFSLSDHGTHNLAKGKAVFGENCTGCHGQNGEGSFGPNLTDNYFIHGHHLHTVIHIVRHGNSKGMTAFGHHLTHHQIRDVAHYVISLRGTNPPSPKAPQGKLLK